MIFTWKLQNVISNTPQQEQNCRVNKQKARWDSLHQYLSVHIIQMVMDASL